MSVRRPKKVIQKKNESEPVEEAVKAFEEMSEQAEEQPEIAGETAESASTLEEEFAHQKYTS